MGTTENAAIGFDAMTDNPTTAVPADGSQRLDGAFKAVEDMRLSGQRYSEGFVVNIAAGFTGDGIAHNGQLGSFDIAGILAGGPARFSDLLRPDHSTRRTR